MKKRIFAVLTAVLLLCACLPLGTVSVSAIMYGDVSYEITDGEVTIIDCAENVTSVEIPSTIEGYPVTTIGGSAFEYCGSLESVTIPDSVTTIGSAAFAYCDSLTSVTIPNSVTTIGFFAFYFCTALTTITIPDSVTTIGDAAFNSCTALTTITIPDSVTTIGDAAFFSCTSLETVTIPDSVTTIGDIAFYACDALTTVHYHGTKEDKAAISIGSDNSPFTSATWHYYDDAYDADCNDCGEWREVALTYGDLNGDGAVNARDLVLFQQYMAGWDVTFIFAAADLDGDDRIVARDLAMLQQYIAGWDITFG